MCVFLHISILVLLKKLQYKDKESNTWRPSYFNTYHESNKDEFILKRTHFLFARNYDTMHAHIHQWNKHMQNRVIMILSFKIKAQRVLLRKLKIIMLAIWQKSKPQWLWANKHIKCNVNLVFKVKNQANQQLPRPNDLELLWWTNSGLKFCRGELQERFLKTKKQTCGMKHHNTYK